MKFPCKRARIAARPWKTLILWDFRGCPISEKPEKTRQLSGASWPSFIFLSSESSFQLRLRHQDPCGQTAGRFEGFLGSIKGTVDVESALAACRQARSFISKAKAVRALNATTGACARPRTWAGACARPCTWKGACNWTAGDDQMEFLTKSNKIKTVIQIKRQ